MILDKIHDSKDLRALSPEELSPLAEEVRQDLGTVPPALGVSAPGVHPVAARGEPLRVDDRECSIKQLIARERPFTLVTRHAESALVAVAECRTKAPVAVSTDETKPAEGDQRAALTFRRTAANRGGPADLTQ